MVLKTLQEIKPGKSHIESGIVGCLIPTRSLPFLLRMLLYFIRPPDRPPYVALAVSDARDERNRG